MSSPILSDAPRAPAPVDETPAAPLAPVAAAEPTVVLLDDDHSLRRGMARLLAEHGLRAAGFATLGELLASGIADGPGCLMLDLYIPGLDGMQLLTLLREAGCEMPVVFLTGHGDVTTSVRAMKSGAVDFLVKPPREDHRLESVRRALAIDAEARARRALVDDLARRYDALTLRERQVFALVVRGLLNKQIAARLGLVEKTVKVHRSRLTTKMGAASLPDLVRMADRLVAHVPALRVATFGPGAAVS